MNAKKKYENIHLTPNKSVIMVTARKCGSNVQPDVRTDVPYAVVGVDTLSNGCPVAVVQNPNRKGKTMRINADRFCWREIHADEIITEVRRINKEQDVDETLNSLKQHFSDDEINRMLFIPYCIEFMALHYLDKCMQYARDEKVSCLIKVGRLAKDVLDKARRDKIAELTENAYNDLHRDAMLFITENSIHFTRLWFTVNNCLKKLNAPERHLTMVTDALCGIQLMDVLDEFHRQREQKVFAVMHRQVLCCYERRKYAVRSILDAYASVINKMLATPITLNDYSLILARRVLINKLNEVTFLSVQRSEII